jgi:tetratricopeptide (TPR) repeat protein
MDESIKSLSEESIKNFQAKKYKEAAQGFRSCVSALEKSGDSLDLAEARNNLCVALIHAGEAEEALSVVTGTDEVFAKAGDGRRQGMALANRANALESLKRYDEAIAAYESARDCLRACGEKKLLAITLRSLSDLQMKTGRQYQAVATLQDAYEQNPDGKIKNKFFSQGIKQVIKKITGR